MEVKDLILHTSYLEILEFLMVLGVSRGEIPVYAEFVRHLKEVPPLKTGRILCLRYNKKGYPVITKGNLNGKRIEEVLGMDICLGYVRPSEALAKILILLTH